MQDIETHQIALELALKTTYSFIDPPTTKEILDRADKFYSYLKTQTHV